MKFWYYYKNEMLNLYYYVPYIYQYSPLPFHYINETRILHKQFLIFDELNYLPNPINEYLHNSYHTDSNWMALHDIWKSVESSSLGKSYFYNLHIKLYINEENIHEAAMLNSNNKISGIIYTSTVSFQTVYNRLLKSDIQSFVLLVINYIHFCAL